MIARLALAALAAAFAAPALAGGPPTLTLEDGAAPENTRNLVVTARLSAPSRRPVLATVRIAASEATEGVDYLAPAPRLILMPGETSARITLTVLNDRRQEGDERIVVALGQVEGAKLARGRAVATIRDDDRSEPQFHRASLGTAPKARPERPAHAALGPLSTHAGRIVDANGRSVRLHGVNWFGLETPNFAPHGLWTRNWRAMMRQMRDMGFNVIRLPFSNQLLAERDRPNGVDTHKNADLKGLTGLQIMDKIVAYAGVLGLRVILDNHRIDAGHGAQASGLWHGPGFSEDQWIADWRRLAKRYRKMPAVIGADLFNEPHNAARWGGGGRNDWRRAAERAGAAILAENPNWLIVVEGVAKAGGSHYWDGGNLAGARRLPVRLPRPDKLVYSTHVYPASVYAQPWLRQAGFAERLPEVWRRHWAFLFEQQEAPVLIGEFGSHMRTAADRAWMRALVAFLRRPAAEGRVAWTYWAWNPNSGDTGGILKDDWRQAHGRKLAAIRPLLPDGFADPTPRAAGGAVARLPAPTDRPG